MLQLSIFKRSSAFSGSPVNTGSLLFMMMMMCGIFLLLVTTRSVEAWTSTSSSSSTSTSTIQYPHRLASFKMRQESAPFRLLQHRTSTCNMRRTDGRLFLSQSVPEDEEKLESSSGSELPKDTNTTVTNLTPKKKSFVARMKSYFQPADDGLTFRQRLSKMGLSVLLSYGWVSNMSYGVSVTCAWYISCKRTGLSPLAPGQWKGFLGVYAGFYVFNNIVRPARVALAVTLGPQFERWLEGWQRRLKVNRATAIAIQVFLFNVVMTVGVMAGGILLASTWAGVPVFVKK